MASAQAATPDVATRPAQRQVFEFRYDRKGPTTHWKLGDDAESEVQEGENLGVKLIEHDDRMEWYRVVIDRRDGEDPDDLKGRAMDLAEAEFLRRHPGCYLAP